MMPIHHNVLGGPGAQAAQRQTTHQPVLSTLKSMTGVVQLFRQATAGQQQQQALQLAQLAQRHFAQALREIDNISVGDLAYAPAVAEMRHRLAEAWAEPALRGHIEYLAHDFAQHELDALPKAAVFFGCMDLWSTEANVYDGFLQDFACNSTNPFARTAAAEMLRQRDVERSTEVLASQQLMDMALYVPLVPQQLVPPPYHYQAAMVDPQGAQDWQAPPAYVPQEVWQGPQACEPEALDAQMHGQPLPGQTTDDAYEYAYKTLESLQAALDEALQYRGSTQQLAPLWANVIHEEAAAWRRMERVPVGDDGYSNALYRNYRTLICSASRAHKEGRASNSVRKKLEQFSAKIEAKDQQFLALCEAACTSGDHDEALACRMDVAAIRRFSLSEDVAERAIDLLKEIDNLQGAPQRATLRKRVRGLDTLDMPEKLDKIVELRSISGKRYYTVSTIGRGTYGKYRIAVDENGVRVGIKVIRLKMDAADGLRVSRKDKFNFGDATTATSRENAEGEFQAIRDASKHLDVHDVLEIDGKLYAVMTPMEDELLATRKRINNKKHFNALVLYAMHEVTKELAELHAKGRVHGDLKAGNVLVNGEGTVAAADFGTSKILQPQAGPRPWTKLVGTYPPPGYENGWGQDADIWALGTMFLNMHRRTPDDPFNYYALDGESFRRWYARIPRTNDGALRVDALPERTAEEATWTAACRGALIASESMTRLVLDRMLNPDPDLRATASQLLAEVAVTDDVREAARQGLHEMALKGDKEAIYQALEEYAEAEALYDETAFDDVIMDHEG